MTDTEIFNIIKIIKQEYPWMIIYQGISLYGVEYTFIPCAYGLPIMKEIIDTILSKYIAHSIYIVSIDNGIKFQLKKSPFHVYYRSL